MLLLEPLDWLDDELLLLDETVELLLLDPLDELDELDELELLDELLLEPGQNGSIGRHSCPKLGGIDTARVWATYFRRRPFP